MTTLKYDVVRHEGEAVSVTVFAGAASYVATKGHPSFQKIIGTIKTGVAPGSEKDLISLFDVSVALKAGFGRLSERVLVNSGKIFFDGDEINDGVTQQIVKYHAENDRQGYAPLVAFLEKISTNPNPHSREHLFRWLGKHEYAIAEDGDFFAYKGLNSDDKSVSSGTALVNGAKVTGRIPNLPDTIIEMPRSEVMFDPRQGCSTGLHAANWRFASRFANKVVLVKINPRDVVSVPTDSSDEKLRVCRYKVIGEVVAPKENVLYPGRFDRTAKVVEPPKPKPKAAKPAAKKSKRQEPIKFPAYYDDFKREHFEALSMAELKWLAKQDGWETTASTQRKSMLVDALTRKAAARLRRWKKEHGK